MTRSPLSILLSLGEECRDECCNPPEEPWAERWIVIVPSVAVAVGVAVLTWTGKLL